jgi:class 3 adenylate cyclase
VTRPPESSSEHPIRHSREDQRAAGRDALRRHAWREAFERLRDADSAEPLPPEDLELLAQAAGWVGRLDDCIAVHERAHAVYLERGDRRRAGYLALLLGHDHFSKGKGSQAKGWMRRAEQLLAAEQDSIEYGHLLRARGLMAKDPDEGLAHARAAYELATRFGDRDLAALELQEQGRLLVAKGEVAGGLALLEDAAMTAVSGTLGALATGDIFCNAIDVCRRLADYGRASEWTDAAHHWCDRQGILGFPGACRVSRAGILRLRGELTAAEEAFRQAHEMGRDPQPGLSLLRLAEGKVEAARTAIRSALADESRDRLARSHLLPAQVDIALASNDLDGARAAADELGAIAAVYGTPALEAAAQCMRGQVLLAAGDEAGALRSLRAGCRLWQELDAPYETARARMALAAVYRAAGDLETAALELTAARSAFERLGAVLDIARAVEAQASAAPAHAAEPAAPRAEARTFMFTDIVRSTQLIEAIGDEAWTDLVRWHDQTLRALFATHGGEEVDHAGDGFFMAFATPHPAIECGVAIQRTLLDHRRRQGFAPQVRIGLHAAPAQRDENAYRGKGVHVAARIAALAEAGEILASRDTVESPPPGITLSVPRPVTLKGVSEPLEVVALAWR